jgi:hypothetical protein
MQREGINFVETVALVAKFESITCLIAIAAYYGLKLKQVDVVIAFLNRMIKNVSAFNLLKVLKFQRNSRKELLLFIW